MNLVFLGAPGAGKGTQAAKIAISNNMFHLSTGDVFRFEIKNNTELGQKAKSFIDKGELVPDELVVDMVASKVKEVTEFNGVIFDGFPRTLQQAQAMEGKIPVDLVINIDVDTKVLIKRLSSRRFCPKCGNTQPESVGGSCSKCGEEVILRDDDKEEVISNRMKVYENQTKPLIDYYKAQDKLIVINGDQDIELVSSEINSAIEKMS